MFADVSCPFAHVGLRRLVERRTQTGNAEPRLLVRAWPLELVNGEPLDPPMLTLKIHALREQVAGDLFVGYDEHVLAGSFLPAMGLAARAYRHSVVAGEQVSLALRDALFERGQRLDDPLLLASIAEAHDLDPTGSPADERAVRADWQEGQQRGVIGSPHFFTAHGDFFCPSLTITHEDDRLVIQADPAAFDRFIAQTVT